MFKYVAELLVDNPAVFHLLQVAAVLTAVLGLFCLFPRVMEAIFALVGVLYFLGVLR
jgi:hypothetical protein